MGGGYLVESSSAAAGDTVIISIRWNNSSFVLPSLLFCYVHDSNINKERWLSSGTVPPPLHPLPGCVSGLGSGSLPQHKSTFTKEARNCGMPATTLTSNSISWIWMFSVIRDVLYVCSGILLLLYNIQLEFYYYCIVMQHASDCVEEVDSLKSWYLT